MKGLNKKLKELTTLCGIDACAIVYSPYEPQPEVWPNCLGVQQMLAEFLRMPPKDQFRKMVNQDSYIRERIKKTDEELKKKIKENWELKMTAVMYQCLIGNVSPANLSMTNLNDLGLLIDHKLAEIDSMLESLKKAVPADQNHCHSYINHRRLSVCSNITNDHLMARGVPGHEHSLEKQPMGGILDSMDEMRSPKYFMNLLMGPD
ncbi:Transcription factor, MADS-box [Cynara cardunculus var. scolymus]|uniref:Transcription factor, MADS-box n=1 Tax=Cynara cardunculus var. scolymus TaxID=59895 RepID=A0A103XS83_CYNCS|nr:Transcription factor, MADS-box [Cynara cardunculus var. scolymus]